MEQYALKDAQEHLQKLIDDAQDGKIVLILDEQKSCCKTCSDDRPSQTP